MPPQPLKGRLLIAIKAKYITVVFCQVKMKKQVIFFFCHPERSEGSPMMNRASPQLTNMSLSMAWQSH